MELMAGDLKCLKIQAMENWFLPISGALSFINNICAFTLEHNNTMFPGLATLKSKSK
jgi:hypothetical protein